MRPCNAWLVAGGIAAVDEVRGFKAGGLRSCRDGFTKREVCVCVRELFDARDCRRNFYAIRIEAKLRRAVEKVCVSY